MIEDKKEAKILARNIIADLTSEIGKKEVNEAKKMGMATSIYASQIANAKEKFLAQISPELTDAPDIFEVEISKQFM
ncbi:unnamed protein product [marine sediment metagenome]|uniref:Uncharacterized protein n=1 Tax=marine sediment metagenome TaxID=412755 RepID=X1I9T8_9ZZZZ